MLMGETLVLMGETLLQIGETLLVFKISNKRTFESEYARGALMAGAKLRKVILNSKRSSLPCPNTHPVSVPCEYDRPQGCLGLSGPLMTKRHFGQYE